MDARQIIAALGGTSKVASLLGCSRTAVSNWARVGIPARYWFPVLDEALRLGANGVTRETVRWRPEKQAEAA